MSLRTSGGVEVDVCDVCNGLWLDAGEFDALVATRFSGRAAEARLDHSARVPATCRFCNLSQPGRKACERCDRPLGIACPVDGRAMYVVLFEGFEFDRCPRCKGIWIDGDERRALAGRQAPPRANEAPANDAGAGDAAPGGDWSGGGDVPGGDWSGGGWSNDGAASRDSAPPGAAARHTVTGGAVAGDSVAGCSAGRATNRELIERYAPREVACGGCDEPVNRYTAWKHEGQFFCAPCVAAGRGVVSQLARERASETPSFFEQPNMTVTCKACRAVVARYVAWEFDGEHWCQRCVDRDEVRERARGAVLVARAGADLERKRARAEELKSDPLLDRNAASPVYRMRLANDMFIIKSLMERFFSS